MSIIQATRSVANIMNIDAYKLKTASIGEDIVVHHPNPTLGRHSRETWKVMMKIGQGGFGSVWLEKEQGTGALRAVKKIYLEKSRNFPYSRELNALIKVWNHRELFVQFLGWYEKTDFVFVTMEYLENGDLEKYLKSSRLKAKSEAKEIATQLLEGLKVLHENKICHRDLKPNNILIARYSPIQVKLADFGSSKSTINTSLRTSCGTSGYMAPELLKLLPSKKRYTNSLDIWSLGCVIHEILTSELPFLRKSEDTDSSASSSSTIRDPEPAYSTPEVDVDIGILMSFCEGKTHFPEDVLLLAGVSVVGIDFLKSLLAANPALRMSASEALQSRDTWFFEMREELHQEDSPYILKEQFYSLGIVLSSSVINSLITQCRMRRGFDVKCTDLGSIPFLTNAIYEAIKRGSIKTMISVLRGASLVNTKKFCQMAFYLAAELGYPAAIMPLLSWGQLDVDSKTEDDETALHLAAASGHDEVVALLLDRGAYIGSRTEDGDMALHLAAGSGHHKVVALLLDRGADMESETEYGEETALHLAAGLGYHKVVTILLDRGQD
ncbi:kinase-like domain-containing protein [Morchella snyderi]|nr:kinase-like domain-containing protein [Morchella snyderi]